MKKVLKNFTKVLSTAINFAVITFLILMLIIGCYVLWDTKIVHTQGGSAHWEPYKPSAENKMSFEELQSINPDVKAWITLYGTGVDFPVVYSNEQNYYLFRDAKGQRSMVGSIFMDSNCSPDFSDYSTILFGHNMEAHAMFGDLSQYSDKAFFNSHEHGNLFFNGQNHGLTVLGHIKTQEGDSSVYRTKIYGADNQWAYYNGLRAKSSPWRTTAYDLSQNLVILSTCSSETTEGRTILVTALSDEVFDNPFGEIANTGIGVEDLKGLFGFPWVGWFAALVVIIMLIVFVLWQIDKRRKAKYKVNSEWYY